MGLAICVGVLATLEDDPEGRQYHQEQLARVNTLLSASGAPIHAEPIACEVWHVELFGYSGLHYLRRVAAHLELRGALPGPGGDQAAEDPTIAEYGDRAAGVAHGIRRLFGKARPQRLAFDHLMLHSDAVGYYVPVDFDRVLLTDDEELGGGMVGSSQQLLIECSRLRDALGIPADLDAEADELWDAADAQGDGEGWRRYGVEAFTCVRLLRAAELSVRRGAAIAFC